MANSIRTNDILWTRNGDPVLVDKTDENSGQVFVTDKFPNVQKEVKLGIKNGLSVPQRDAFKSTISEVQGADKKKEIIDLFQKIKSLKENNGDMRVIKYLENELQYRMIREDYKPGDYPVKPVTLDI